MKIISTDNPEFQRVLHDFKSRLSSENETIEEQIKEIIFNVRQKGDISLLEYTKQFDNVHLEKADLTVGHEEIEKAYKTVTTEYLNALRFAIENITAFHNRQSRNTWIHFAPNGNILGQLITPLDKVGIYIPGGKAPYPSTVLMCSIPAKIAGVKEIYCVSPPQSGKKIDPSIIVAADMVGISRIFKIGGVQAVAALSYGTETIPMVDKIVGPGNIYVTLAKRLVFGQVDIDMLAGPSEIMIIADETAPPEFIAADILSQAEHDERASSMLLTPCGGLIDDVTKEIEFQLERLARKQICINSLENYGLMIRVKDIDQAIEITNHLGPEHLELAIQDPFPLLNKIKNAGSIFLGYYTPEAIGDYVAGPNHVLPTGGSARFFSVLGVDDFVKRSGISYYSKGMLKQMGETAMLLAKTEGLDAHANSIDIRLRYMALDKNENSRE